MLAKRSILICVIVCLGLPVLAGKPKLFTHKYRNERLEVVLDDLCQRNGYTLNITDEDIDLNKPITANFRKVRTSYVLKKVLDADYQGKVKHGVMTISRKAAKPIQYDVPAVAPAEVIENDTVRTTIWQDTIFTVRCRHVTYADTIAITHTPGADIRHNVQLLVGAGYGSMGYSLEDYVGSYAAGSFCGSLQTRYLYHLTRNWGVGLGIGVSSFATTAVLNTTVRYYSRSAEYMPDTDSDGELYGHAIRLHRWTEQQRVWMVDIPLMAQYTSPVQAPSLTRGTMRIYLNLGLNLGMCVSSERQLCDGSLQHMGWYKPWNLTLEDVDGHDFYTEQAADYGLEKKTFALRLPAVGVMADFGVAIPVSSKMDVLMGAYINYTLNNVCARTSDLFVHGTYDGIVGSQFAKTVHPWQVGVRVGIGFHTGITRDDNPKGYDVIYTRDEICNTTYMLRPRIETSRVNTTEN